MRPRTNNSLLFLLITAALLLAACSAGPGGNRGNAAQPATNANRPAEQNRNVSANTNTGINEAVPGTQGFSTADVCTLPKEAGAGTPFAQLGGGMWAKWDEGVEIGYGCDGGSDSIKLEVEQAKISAYYSVLGTAEKVNNVSAKYIALQYGGKIPKEDQLRQEFTRFCENLSMRLMGEKLPGNIVERLNGAPAGGTSERPAEIEEKAGGGIVKLSAVSSKDGMLTIEVRFFENASAYQQYKNF